MDVGLSYYFIVAGRHVLITCFVHDEEVRPMLGLSVTGDVVLPKEFLSQHSHI